MLGYYSHTYILYTGFKNQGRQTLTTTQTMFRYYNNQENILYLATIEYLHCNALDSQVIVDVVFLIHQHDTLLRVQPIGVAEEVDVHLHIHTYMHTYI